MREEKTCNSSRRSTVCLGLCQGRKYSAIQPKVQYTTEKPWNELEIRVYPGADGNFILYEDDGETYDYEKGKFAEIPFTWDDASGTLTIGERRGEYPGMLTNRKFNIQVMKPGATSGDTPLTSFAKTVSYDGKSQSVKL